MKRITYMLFLASATLLSGCSKDDGDDSGNGKNEIESTFQLIHAKKVIVDGAKIVADTYIPEGNILSCDIELRNLTDKKISVRVEKKVLSTLPANVAQINYFCWGVCLTPDKNSVQADVAPYVATNEPMLFTGDLETSSLSEEGTTEIKIQYTFTDQTNNLAQKVEISYIYPKENNEEEISNVDLACDAISFSEQPSHTFKANQKLTVQALISNRSLEEVTTFTARYKYGAQEVEQIFNQTIGQESKALITFDTQLVMSNPGDSQDIIVEIVCDGDQNKLNNTSSTQLVCIGTEPSKRALIEKITSFECVACGVVHWNLENTENSNPDKVAVVSVHVDKVVGPDNLGCKSFEEAYVAWTGIPKIQDIFGLPSWATNRRFHGEIFEDARNKTTTPASIDVVVEYNATLKSFDATIKTVFAANAMAEGYYALGLAVLEDGIDAWQMGTYPNATVLHNNTARELIGGNKGVANSLPKNVVKDVENSYTFHHQIPATYGIDVRTPVPANMEVVAILYDVRTGEVLNCIKKPLIRK